MAHIRNVEDLKRLYGPPSERSQQKELGRLDRHMRDFIGHSPFMLLATHGPSGADLSPRGDPAGFVHTPDEQTLLIPDRPGNNRLDSLVNILAQPRVALLFLIPGRDDSLRINGRAHIHDDPELLDRFVMRGKVPASVLKVHVDEAFLHCPKAFVRSHLWQPDQWPDHSGLESLAGMLKDHLKLPIEKAELAQSLDEGVRNGLY